MSTSRDLLRIEAKKAYKMQTKGIQKRNRMPFAQFYKEFKKTKLAQKTIEPAVEEDFDVSEVANVSEIELQGENE